MMLHQTLQTIWRLAGQAVLCSSVLGVLLAGGIAVAIWRRSRRSLKRQGPPRLPAQFPLEQAALQHSVLHVAAEAAAVLQGLQNLATQQFVRLEMAIQPGLAMVGDQRAFRETLGELARSAIEQAPCGCVLLTAARVGCRVHVSVLDDGPGADTATRLTRLRHAQLLVALQGGSLEINARPGEGTTVIVRLPGSDPGVSVTEADRLDHASTEPWNQSRAGNICTLSRPRHSAGNRGLQPPETRFLIR